MSIVETDWKSFLFPGSDLPPDVEVDLTLHSGIFNCAACWGNLVFFDTEEHKISAKKTTLYQIQKLESQWKIISNQQDIRPKQNPLIFEWIFMQTQRQFYHCQHWAPFPFSNYFPDTHQSWQWYAGQAPNSDDKERSAKNLRMYPDWDDPWKGGWQVLPLQDCWRQGLGEKGAHEPWAENAYWCQSLYLASEKWMSCYMFNNNNNV